MLGAILGDVVGSRFEHHPTSSLDFELFTPRCVATDDTVLSCATAEALMTDLDFAGVYRRWGRQYPDAGYGGMFRRWLHSHDPGPYGSLGNGSAMRVAPVGWVAGNLGEALEMAEASARVTHDHPEGIKGAQAVAAALVMARRGLDPETLRRDLESVFGYALSTPVAELRPHTHFDETCPGSVPQALRCGLEARDVEHAVRLAVSLGGDADTQACIAGAVAEARFGGVPWRLDDQLRGHLDHRMTAVLIDFRSRYVPESPGCGHRWPQRRLLWIVRELHRRGYQRLRVVPGMSPSGLHWRCVLAPADAFGSSGSSGSLYPDPGDPDVLSYSSSEGPVAFGWDDGADADTETLADLLLERAPRLAERSRGEDRAYAAWLAEMLTVTAPDGVVTDLTCTDSSAGLPVDGCPRSVVVPRPPEP